MWICAPLCAPIFQLICVYFYFITNSFIITTYPVEKERMAAALFGGMSGAPAPPPPPQVQQTPQMATPQMPSVPHPTPSTPAAVPQPQQPPAPAPEVDLLGKCYILVYLALVVFTHSLTCTFNHSFTFTTHLLTLLFNTIISE